MKTLLKLFFIPILLLLFSSQLFALQIANDTFHSGSKDGWGGDSYTYQNDGWLYFTPDGTATKTYNFGSTYNNQSITITYKGWVDNRWESSGSSKDYFNVLINDTTVQTVISGGGYFTKTINATLSASGSIKVSFNPNTTATNEYSGIDYISIDIADPKLSCPGQVISNLEATTIDATDSDSGVITGDTTYYYYFTPAVAGDIQVDSTVYQGGTSNSLFIKNGCGTDLWSNENDSSSKSSPKISVNANQKIVIALERRYNSNKNFSLNFTFTLPPIAQAGNNTYSVDINGILNENALVDDNGTNIYMHVPITSSPTDGTLSNLNSDGSFTYTPNTNFQGTDSFTYTIEDDFGNTSTATVTINVVPPYSETSGGRPFELRHQESIFGNATMIGNGILCYRGSSGTGSCQNTNASNGNTYLYKAPESYSTLTLPVSATVKYARMYWQGRNTASSNWSSSQKEKAKVLKMRQENDTFVQISADILDTDDDWTTYSASADVTTYVQTHGAGKYYVDPTTFYTIEGKPDGLGAFGAWVLVVVYEDANDAKARNITIFDGYQIIDGSNNVDIPVSGFLTPKSGTVESKTYVFVGEGDKYITGDDLLMKGELYNNSSFTSIAPDSDNAFNSRIDVTGTRNPSLTNNNGIDIQVHDTSSIIATNEIGATFRFTTGGDVYFPSVLVFSTELYLPKLCYDYSIRQDGVYLPVDRSAYPMAQLDGQVSSSNLEIEVYLKNKEADIVAEGIALKMDINDTIFDLVGDIYTSNTNGTTLIGRGTPASTVPLCDYNKNGNNSFLNSGCTTGHDFRKGLGNLGSNQYIYSKFYLDPKSISGISDLNQSLGLSLKYYITAGGNKIEYPDYILGGSNVPLCPPTNGYEPAWGQFNVVQHNQTTNNIFTQISRKPFNVDVIFDATPNTGDHQAPSSDINTTVLVEMIDLDSFGDVNASCANPDSNVSSPIFVALNFDGSNYSTAIPTQNANYFNFATKNTAFRIWAFSDEDDVLIQNWTATTSDTSRLNLTSIHGLYDASKHPLCDSACATVTSPSTSTACFTCIRANYAKPLCSRDNFSVRPESYDIELYDINATATDAVKNATKVNLSNLYHYSPSFTTPMGEMQLTTDYLYRFDIFATGHDSTLRVPGYTRYFNGAEDYNATLLWNSTKTVACNDISSRSIAFYIKNGAMTNEERSQNEIGRYLLNLQDKSWTAVDWNPLFMTHHKVADNFLNPTTLDCQENNTTTTQAKSGCRIDSNHGSDGGNPARVYKDLNITFHPYKFDITSIAPTIGLNRNLITASNSYIYMADLSTDQNMSYHIDGNIIAQSFTGNPLSNFVSGCFAEPLDITIATTDRDLNSSTGGHVDYIVRFHDLNTSGGIDDLLDVNVTESSTDSHTNDLLIQTDKANQGYFSKQLIGTMQTQLELNYNREINNSINPKAITFINYSVKCTTYNNCTYRANLQDNNLSAEKVLNNTIKHYYGRTHGTRQRFTGHSGTTKIYYEVYCGNGCDKTLLPNSLNSRSLDDPRWFINTLHDENSDGKIITVSQKGSTAVTSSAPSYTPPTHNVTLNYDQTNGYPYKATMQVFPSNFLIYNKYNAAATSNDFSVEFISTNSVWAGKRESNTTTKSIGSDITNSRTIPW